MTKNTKLILFVAGITLTICLSIVAPLATFIVFEIKDGMNENEFLAVGKRGKAKILRATDRTRETSKGIFPRAKFLLEVSVPNYPTYQVEVTKSIPVIHAPRLQPNLTIDVLVDPDQPQNEERVELLLEE